MPVHVPVNVDQCYDLVLEGADVCLDDAILIGLCHFVCLDGMDARYAMMSGGACRHTTQAR